MKTIDIKKFCLFITTGMLTISSVHAEDFKLKFNMNLTKIDSSIEQVKVSCKIFSSDVGNPDNSAITAEKIANVSAFGNVTGSVEVTANAPEGYSPSMYNSYDCKLNFKLPASDGGGWIEPWGPTESDCQYETNVVIICAKPGTTYVGRFEGTF